MKYYKTKDTGSEFFDRYNVMFSEDGGPGLVDLFTMSFNANQPNGVCCFHGDCADYEVDGKEVPFRELPTGLQKQIVNTERAYTELG